MVWENILRKLEAKLKGILWLAEKRKERLPAWRREGEKAEGAVQSNIKGILFTLLWNRSWEDAYQKEGNNEHNKEPFNFTYNGNKIHN